MVTGNPPAFTFFTVSSLATALIFVSLGAVVAKKSSDSRGVELFRLLGIVENVGF